METLLVFGGNGLLGGKVAALARESFQVVATYTRTKPRHPGINFVELPKENVEEGMVLVRKTKPSAVIDAEAMDDVDRCEEERDLAWKVNAGSTGSLARVAMDIGARYLFVSTDFVFDGTKGGYRERHEPLRLRGAPREGLRPRPRDGPAGPRGGAPPESPAARERVPLEREGEAPWDRSTPGGRRDRRDEGAAEPR